MQNNPEKLVGLKLSIFLAVEKNAKIKVGNFFFSKKSSKKLTFKHFCAIIISLLTIKANK